MGFIISNTIDEYESAIQTHPPEIRQEYHRGLVPYLHGVAQRSAAPHLVQHFGQLGLSQDDVLVLYRLIFSSSFISAWYHLNGDMERRNKATNLCISLVSSTGLTPEEMMPEYIKVEQITRDVLLSKGVGKRPTTSMTWVAVVGAVVAYVVWALVNAK